MRRHPVSVFSKILLPKCHYYYCTKFCGGDPPFSQALNVADRILLERGKQRGILFSMSEGGGELWAKESLGCWVRGGVLFAIISPDEEFWLGCILLWWFRVAGVPSLGFCRSISFTQHTTPPRLIVSKHALTHPLVVCFVY